MTTPALVVFHDGGDAHHWAECCLKPGFRHVFVCILDRHGYWIRVDAEQGIPVVEVLQTAEYDLEMFYLRSGFAVVRTSQEKQSPRAPMVVANCVGLVKAMLGIRAPFVWTPWQLYRHLVGEP